MEQAIREFRSAHAKKVECEQQIRTLLKELLAQNDGTNVRTKAQKKIWKQRSVAIVRGGNLSQKCNVAERKMIEAILRHAC